MMLLDWSWAIRKFHDYPFEQVQRQMVSGSAVSNRKNNEAKRSFPRLKGTHLRRSY